MSRLCSSALSGVVDVCTLAFTVMPMDCQGIEQRCRYATRPAISNERPSVSREGNVVLKRKTPWHNGTTHIVLTPMEFMQRLAALVPRPLLVSKWAETPTVHVSIQP